MEKTMKYKKILLIVFLLTLFTFQPAQAGATMPFGENRSQINAAQANTNILGVTIKVYVYPLDNNGMLLTPASPVLCNAVFDVGVQGCGIVDPEHDADHKQNPVNLHVEEFYLKDVVATEMNLAEITPDTEGEALKAQAVASRTVANWKAVHSGWMGDVAVNNSTTYQAFIPGTYINSAYKSAIDKAIDGVNGVGGTKGQFLQYIIKDPDTGYDRHAIDAEFFADIETATGNGDLVSAPYQKSVQDPISNNSLCIANVAGQHNYGMSQRGAIRWAKGNTCPNETGETWSVKWDYKQILAHYYTGIEFKNDDASDSSFTPDERWNLLWHNNF
jgi:Stage II sporulation protein